VAAYFIVNTTNSGPNYTTSRDVTLEFGQQVAHDVNPAGRATEVDRMATA
jgi:hypothetical protein